MTLEFLLRQRAAMIVGVGLSIIVAPSARAHDASLHKGKVLEGEVREVSAQSITVEVGDLKEVIVELAPETTVEQDGTAASRDAIHVGAHVAVSGPALPGGHIAAREVDIHSMAEDKGRNHKE